MGSEGKILVFQHVDCEGPGVFGECGARLESFDPAKRLPSEQELSRAAGLIVLGGPMGVYQTERHPWLAREVELVGKAARAGKPVIGICLGSQILAAALGARVYPHDRKEIGWDHIALSPDAMSDPLFCDMPSPLQVFHWHGDTFDLPSRAVLLALSSVCKHQIFRFGKRAWGLQCHLEISREDPANWAAVYAEEVIQTNAPTVGDDFGRDTELYWPRLRTFAGKMAKRFFGFCSGA